jgi:hypothetical protein
MLSSILAGGPFGTCKNLRFSQVGFSAPVRISHCAKGSPARAEKWIFVCGFAQ